ncbi:MAG: O-antigen ligase family protein, partial [Elusimicrobiota bacterium]
SHDAPTAALLACGVLFAVYSNAIGRSLASREREIALALSTSLLYGWTVVTLVGNKSPRLVFPSGRLIHFAVIAGAWLVACVALGIRLLWPNAGLEEILLGNSNIFNFYIGMTLPFALSGIRENNGKKEKLFYLSATFLLATTFVINGSYGAWIIWIAALALSWPGADSVLQRKLFRYGWAAAIVIILILSGLKYRAHPASFANRMAWQKAAIKIMRDHPFLGAGRQGGFAGLYPLYRQKDATESSFWAHNGYLEIGVNWGLIGLILISAAAVCAWLLIPHPCPWNLKMSWCFVALNSFFESSLLILPVSLALFALTAGSSGAGKQSNFRGALQFIPDYAHIACLSFLLALAVPLALGRAHLIRAGLWMNALTIFPDSWPNARDALRLSLKWDPSNADTWADMARLEHALSRSQIPRQARALGAARRVLALEPNHLRSSRLLSMIESGRTIP